MTVSPDGKTEGGHRKSVTINVRAPLTAWQSNVVALSVHMAEAEMFEFGVEQGQMLQVWMRHCQTMKRQETRLRLATAVLLATFVATLVWLQFHQQNTTAFSGARQGALTTEESPIGHTVHLEPFRQIDACSEQQLIEWEKLDYGYDSQNFKLENQTVLHIVTKGLYLINLRISYRVAYGQCKSSRDQLTFVVNVTQQHRNYNEKEREIIHAKESMICRDYWLQSITLNRVIMLEAGTSFRVRINQESCQFVSWVRNSHLDVTSLALASF